ncbi:hypothetical protein F2Q69_00013632 [Brassica cretica]|uniref:Uncharacterized protein n=1 Tax=Brassica cretica TaxID=69181 RepID=A0A8S9QVT4_BRACR|nr:hypothetical protein F2Q69_00013632 [Brassica cretica]
MRLLFSMGWMIRRQLLAPVVYLHRNFSLKANFRTHQSVPPPTPYVRPPAPFVQPQHPHHPRQHQAHPQNAAPAPDLL